MCEVVPTVHPASEAATLASTASKCHTDNRPICTSSQRMFHWFNKIFAKESPQTSSPSAPAINPVERDFALGRLVPTAVEPGYEPQREFHLDAKRGTVREWFEMLPEDRGAPALVRSVSVLPGPKVMIGSRRELVNEQASRGIDPRFVAFNDALLDLHTKTMYAYVYAGPDAWSNWAKRLSDHLLSGGSKKDAKRKGLEYDAQRLHALADGWMTDVRWGFEVPKRIERTFHSAPASSKVEVRSEWPDTLGEDGRPGYRSLPERGGDGFQFGPLALYELLTKGRLRVVIDDQPCPDWCTLEDVRMLQSDPSFGWDPSGELCTVSANAWLDTGGSEQRIWVWDASLDDQPGMWRRWPHTSSRLSLGCPQPQRKVRGTMQADILGCSDLFYPKESLSSPFAHWCLSVDSESRPSISNTHPMGQGIHAGTAPMWGLRRSAFALRLEPLAPLLEGLSLPHAWTDDGLLLVLGCIDADLSQESDAVLVPNAVFALDVPSLRGKPYADLHDLLARYPECAQHTQPMPRLWSQGVDDSRIEVAHWPTDYVPGCGEPFVPVVWWVTAVRENGRIRIDARRPDTE